MSSMAIPPRDSLPEDPAEWQNIHVDFPRLQRDSPESSPISVDEVMDYVRTESADTANAKEDSLRFLRTARVEDQKYWLWSYTEADGEVCYVFVSEDEDGDLMLSLSSTGGLTSEQYLLADFYELVYWS